MQREAELAVVRRFLAHLGAGTTQLAPELLRVPAEEYTSPEHLARETRTLFRRRPVVACLSADLPEPGAFLALESGGVPLVLVRQPGGGVRAFVNACRHRGARLLAGRGALAGGLIRCPFHAWTYAADGRLRAIPLAEEAFAGLDRAGLSLAERPAAERCGVVLVRAEGIEPVDADAVLEGVADDLRALDLARFRHLETRETRWRCNWKLALETFLESYHVFSLHRETVHPWYFSQPMACDAFGANLRFPVVRRSLAELAGKPEAEWRLADHATIQWLVAPNALLSTTRDELLLWRFSSPEPGRCVAVTSFYSARPPDSDAERDRLERAFALQLRVTGTEDFPMQESVQAGLDAGATRELRFGRNEVAAIAFHRALRELLACAEAGAS
jgi:phenylpropionate dioxygenase-like ring-hydroxylating dioxygenase large terminal subunit